MLLPVQIAYSWGLCRLAFSDYPGLLVCFTCFLVIRVISLEFVNTRNFSFFLAYHSGGNTKFHLIPSNSIEIGKQVLSQWHHPRKQSEKVLPISVNRFMVLKPSSLAVHFPPSFHAQWQVWHFQPEVELILMTRWASNKSFPLSITLGWTSQDKNCI